jgi:GntR family transcriptional regulator, transcriptional repressor for pyruvate dehydrogenase complex
VSRLDDQGRRQTPQPPRDNGAVEPQVKTLSLVDSASRRVASMILDGTLKTGDRLPPERELATQLGLSRGVLREALRSLEYVGLLQAKVGSGRYVTQNRPDDPASGISVWMQLQPIGEVISVRRILEPAALASVPALHVAQLAVDVRAKYRQMASAYKRGAHEAATRHHSEFHLTLTRYAASRLHRVLLASMIEVAAVTQLEIFRTGRAGLHSLQHHLPIVEALERGDVGEAARAVAEHLAPAFTYSDVSP